MQPFYFGSAEKKLLGLYHAPNTQAWPNPSVLICQPIGHEYMRMHRFFRLLADTLSLKGFHVLRFDYFATGDSAGEDGEGSVGQWLEDLRLALIELEAISGNANSSVLAARLAVPLFLKSVGDSLSQENIKSVFCLDAILCGKAYLSSLGEMHLDALEDSDRYHVNRREGQEHATDLLGFSYPEKLRSGIKNLDINGLENEAKEKVFYISSNNDFGYDCEWRSPSVIESAIVNDSFLNKLAELLIRNTK